MKELGRLYLGVDCSNCGKHDEGVPASGGDSIRCSQCGRFGEEPTDYCAQHNVDYEGLYPEDNHCPYCREEQRRRDAIQHERTRDPQMEPW